MSCEKFRDEPNVNAHQLCSEHVLDSLFVSPPVTQIAVFMTDTNTKETKTQTEALCEANRHVL